MTNANKLKCSLGIFAYNEEKNIADLLAAILNQQLAFGEIEEIFVIASGCTDKTVVIAKEFSSKDPRIKVLVQEKREGKFSAINLFLQSAKNEILIMESADTLPEKQTLEKLIQVFKNSRAGMAGARPMPVDKPETFLGFTVYLLWSLHHLLSLKNPKMGELVAFRKVFSEIPRTATDEAYIESLIKGKGYEIVYAPEAIVYNKGPETISDFLKSRRRVFAGHLDLKKKTGYQVSSFNSGIILISLWELFKNDKKVRNKFFYLPAVIFLEMLGRFLGWWDYNVKKKDHVIWEIAKTARKVK
jgi:cellulose synthase/poly-beta-1,6-N-acetylglucosamine synthase-like glycosyltransferase